MQRPKSLRLAGLLAITIMCGLEAPLRAQSAAPKEDAGDTWAAIEEALGGGRIWLKFRYRYEDVDMGTVSKNAQASTLRTVLGYETGAFHGISGLLELEDVSPIGDDDYNSTVNGNVTRPVVADPNHTELNQVFLRYNPHDTYEALLGRQRIKLDNDRFVGNVGWRQNEQTYDALTATGQVGSFDVFYGYLQNVNRIFGDDSAVGDHRMDSHLINFSRSFEDVGKVSVYGYFLDYDDAKALSTSTQGVRLKGERSATDSLDVLYTAEFAQQSDAGSNPNNVDADYTLLELGARAAGITVKVGREELEGSGAVGDKFTTPLATLHAFNGWADQFLATPDTGLEDTYVSVGTKIGKAKLLGVYHDFSANSNSMDYGTELDLLLSFPIRKNVSVGLKAADYDADGFGVDVRKLWFWLTLST